MKLNDLGNLSQKVDRVNNAANNVVNRVSNVQSTVENTANKVQNTINNTQRGITNTVDKVSSLGTKASELGSKVSSIGTSASKGFTSLSSKIGNLFGGSDIASSSAVKTAGSGESGASPGAKIPGFSGDPKAQLPSIDPLKREVSAPFSPSNAAASSVMDYFHPSKISSILGDGFTSIRSVANSVGTGISAVKARIEDGMNMAGQIARLPKQVQQEMQSYVDLYNSTRSEIEATVDGVKTTFKDLTDYDNYRSITGFLDTYNSRSDKGSLDYGSSGAIVFSLANALSQYNQPAKIQALIDGMTDETAKQNMYRELLVAASGEGNLSTVEYYLGVMDLLVARQVDAEVVVNLMMNLQVETNPSYKDYGSRLLAVFNTLDVNWDLDVDPHGILRRTLYPYTFCNANVINSLMTTDRYRYVVAASNYGYEKASDLVDSAFPI